MSSKLVIRDLSLMALVGVHPHERTTRQPILINIEYWIDHYPNEDTLAETVCYETIVRDVEAIVKTSSPLLVEMLAADISRAVLADPRVSRTLVRVEKTSAISNARSVGIEIEASQDDNG